LRAAEAEVGRLAGDLAAQVEWGKHFRERRLVAERSLAKLREAVRELRAVEGSHDGLPAWDAAQQANVAAATKRLYALADSLDQETGQGK
jgi:hypothetical protein